MYLSEDTIPPNSTVQLPLITAEDCAYVVYSSGTTGKPKGFF